MKIIDSETGFLLFGKCLSLTYLVRFVNQLL